jgi:SAM-dependent methyltransferase
MERDPVAPTGEEVLELWDQKAAFWDQRMGDGNDFQRLLVGPATERLLQVQPGELALDVACGNGVFSRRLAELGADVVAVDFSPQFIDAARAHSASDQAERVSYSVVDVTDRQELLTLGARRFDAAVCNMALMDIANIEPLTAALAQLLKPSGRFVFSVTHPCFNFAGGSTLALEEDDPRGELRETRLVKVTNYLHVPPTRGAGMPGEPNPHFYFHRPLSVLLGTCFAAGFALDGIEEPAFGAGSHSDRPLSWANFRDIPPVLVARLRLPGS